MKRIIIILIVAFSFSSCKKYLDKSPFDSLTSEQAFSNEQNIKLYVNSFYQQMIPTAQDVFKGDNMSDICSVRDVPGYLGGIFTSQQATGWTWGTLRNINYFLSRINSAPLTQDKINYYTAIAKFFRSWFYFDMVKQYGDVPWYNKPLDPTDSALYNPRSPRTLIMDSVLADINEACTYLDTKKDNSSTIITKWVALGMKSRICLFEGTFRKYQTQFNLTGTADGWLQLAAAAASEVIESKIYDVYNTNKPTSDYRSLFISSTPQNKEVMLAAVYNNDLQLWHDANWNFTAASYGGNVSLNKSFIETYLNLDGTRFTDILKFDTLPFHKEVKNRDARLSQTIRMGAYKRSDGLPAPPDFGQTYTGYQILKFTTEDKSIDTKVGNFNAIPIMRYAEILLNFAEAKAELGTLSATDWDNSIALLRKRAGITNTSMPPTIDAHLQTNFFPDVSSASILEIRRERGVELAVEGFRYDDLKRWKAGKLLEKTYDGIYVPAMNTLIDLNEDAKADVSFVTTLPSPRVPGVIYYIIDNKASKLSNGTKGKLLWRANVVKSYEEYKYLAPIPYSQLLLNLNLVQNPGW